MRTLAALAAGVLAANAGVAAAADAVPGRPGVTQQDLLKQIAPDLADAGDNLTGHVAGTLRHLSDHDYTGELPDPQVFTETEVRRLRAEGRAWLVLMTDLGPSEDSVSSNTLVALFTDAARPKLVDMAAVGLDRLTGFNDPDRVKIGPADEALITYSEHFNSNQTYAARLMFFVRAGKLRLIDDVFALSERECGWEVDEIPKFTSRPDPGRRYWQVTVDVTEQRTVDRKEDCGDEKKGRPYVRHYRSVYRWDEARGRFVASPDGLRRLDKLNGVRF